jgi:hypothetical protein
VPDPETKPQPKRKKKSIKYKIETKATKQIKQITTVYPPKGRKKPPMQIEEVYAWATASHHAAENSTPCNPRPQMTDS